MRPGVFGRVYTHWKRLNPEARPTVLFGPDVAGAIYFAEEFTRKGVRAAHIDAKQIWYNGEYMDSDDENREWLLKTFESGEIQLLTSRWVLKEGIDLPFVAHAIFACVVGSLKSWLQMGGRAIRYHPDTPSVIIQDHGGCFRRHGSLNADRHWELGMSGYRETGLRQEAMREKPEIEPILCSKCGMMRLSGPTCPACGYSCHKRSKMVVQINGDLKLVEGPTYKKHRVKMESDTVGKWTKMFHRARSKKWNGTFNQALAMFAQENNWFYPPKDLPFMPYDPSDWYQKVSTIWKRNPDGSNAPFPHDRLRSKDS
jgi:hypothetical protein